MSGLTVIAEMGSSHHGLREWARELVAVAKVCGADMVKAQFFGDPVALAKRRGLPEHYAQAYRTYGLPAAWLPELWALAHAHGLTFLCTAFQPEDVATIAPHVDAFKVASLEAEDEDLLAAIAAVDDGRQVYVSLGCGASAETAIRILGREVVTLHCVSAYPTPDDQLNLARCASLGGYSDHSDGTHELTGALAVAAGARVLEVHYRLDATPRENPDWPHSKPPHVLRAYIAHARHAARCLGDGRDAAMPCEAPLAEKAENRQNPLRKPGH